MLQTSCSTGWRRHHIANDGLAPPRVAAASAPPSVACPVAEHHDRYLLQRRRWPRIQTRMYCSNRCAIKSLPVRRRTEQQRQLWRRQQRLWGRWWPHLLDSRVRSRWTTRLERHRLPTATMVASSRCFAVAVGTAAALPA